jgi:Tfp pilus assembly protein PilF
MSVLARPGDLADVPLATLLVEALDQRFTGELHVAEAGATWRLLLAEGRLVAVIAPGRDRPERPAQQTATLARLGALAHGRFSFETDPATAPELDGAVVDMAELGGVLAEPAGRDHQAATRRSDPEEARRRRQRLLRQGMRNLGVGPLAGPPRPAARAQAGAEKGAAAGKAAPPPEAEAEPASERAQRAELRRALAEVAPRARSADLYARLGVSPRASADELRKAYFELARRIHPDHFAAPELADVAPLAKEVFAAINEAHEVLSDERKRAAAARTAPAVPHAPTEERRAAAAVDFQKAEACARTRDHDRARGYYEAALRADPRAEYQEAYAWMLYSQQRPVDRARARDLAEAALQDRRRDRAALVRALIARDEGDDGRVEQLLRRALQANPDNADAQRELRAWQARRDERTREARRDLRAADAAGRRDDREAGRRRADPGGRRRGR